MIRVLLPDSLCRDVLLDSRCLLWRTSSNLNFFSLSTVTLMFLNRKGSTQCSWIVFLTYHALWSNLKSCLMVKVCLDTIIPDWHVIFWNLLLLLRLIVLIYFDNFIHHFLWYCPSHKLIKFMLYFTQNNWQSLLNLQTIHLWEKY